MKLITWILIFAFSINTMAATVREGLEAAMNDYEYSMVVDWDQKDQKQAEAFAENFVAKLNALYAQGLSQAEVVKYIESRVHDKKQLEKMRTLATMNAKGISTGKDIAQLLQDNRESFGLKGASWNGSTTALVIAPILILGALIVYQLVWGLGHRCAQAQMEEHCGEESYCSDWDTDWETGNEYCDDWDTSYECHNVEVCLQYEKKP